MDEGKYVPIEPRPGLRRDTTAYAAEGHWYDSDRIHFVEGKPESWRGWQVKTVNTVYGTPRTIKAWSDIETNEWFAAGTECGLFVHYGGVMYDITPVRASGAVTSVFNTSANSLTVTISVSNHGIGSVNTRVVVTSATSVANLLLSGPYPTVSIVNTNVFQINASTSANATVTQGGSGNLDFLIDCGSSTGGGGAGWGAGVWGHSGGWGAAVSAGADLVPLRVWTLDNWGEDLLATYNNGAVYVWQTSLGQGTRATLVSNAPQRNLSLVIGSDIRSLITLGTVDITTSIFDPLLVRWSDSENYNLFTPTVSNAAGGVRIASGSRIEGAVRSRNQILIWTDDSLHGMTHVGPPDIYHFRLLGTKCGLIGPNAKVEMNGVAYWMSRNGMFRFDGAMTIVPCPIINEVLEEINLEQVDKVVCGANQEFTALIWIYPAGSSSEVNKYILYDMLEQAWSRGAISFTAWADQVPFDNIIVGQPDGLFYDHEVRDYFLAAGSAMGSFVETAEFDLGDGDSLMHISRLVPDMDMTSAGGVEYIVKAKNYPGQTFKQKGPFLVQAETPHVGVRLRGRRAVFRVQTATSIPATHWRLGKPLIRVQEDGQR